MRDPCLVAGDGIFAAIICLHRACAQAAKIGTGIRFGEHGCWQDFAAGNLWQPCLLLIVRAANQDQFGRDLAARAQRPGADVAARKFFRDDAHGNLAHAETAEFLWDGQAEHAKLSHFTDHIHRDVVIAHMPAMGMRLDLVVGEFRELFAHHAHGFVEPGFLNRVARQGVRQQACGSGHRRGRLALGNQAVDRRIGK